MSKTKQRKPTAKEQNQAIVGLIKEIESLHQRANFLYNTLAHYIKYKNDEDGFAEFLEKQVEQINKETSNAEQGTINKDTQRK